MDGRLLWFQLDPAPTTEEEVRSFFPKPEEIQPYPRESFWLLEYSPLAQGPVARIKDLKERLRQETQTYNWAYDWYTEVYYGGIENSPKSAHDLKYYDHGDVLFSACRTLESLLNHTRRSMLNVQVLEEMLDKVEIDKPLALLDSPGPVIIKAAAPPAVKPVKVAEELTMSLF